jgi:class 3 adenylate cyclase
MERRELPTGTVTFLFSDMEGSTRLVADLGPAVFTDVLERHNRVLRAAFGAHGGIERGTQGDSFLVMFREAPAALAAAAEAQRGLAETDWPGSADVRVRMGIHTGVGTLGGDDYVGLDVSRAARISGAAHGGQVLLSDATRALVDQALSPGLSLRNLGEHTLRDLGRPERELRCHFGGDHYRILYRRSKNLFVLLHFLAKHSAAIPSADIRIAEARWDDFASRMNERPRRPPRAAGHDAS